MNRNMSRTTNKKHDLLYGVRSGIWDMGRSKGRARVGFKLAVTTLAFLLMAFLAFLALTPSTRANLAEAASANAPASAAQPVPPILLISPILTPSPIPTPLCGWNITTSPNPGLPNDLNDVAALSPNNVWAVGDYYDGYTYRTLIEHWDGTQWSITPSSNISGAYLDGISAINANDIWAVGGYGADLTLAEHWNGAQWSVVPTSGVYSGHGILRSVAALSPNDVWAVGYYESQTLTEHWDGTQWNWVANPSINGYIHLKDVAAISSNDVWAVGDDGGHTLVLHWDGAQWNSVPTPGPSIDANHLDSVSAAGHNDVWAVGSSYGASFIIHCTMDCDDTQHSNWSIVPTPDPDPNPNAADFLYAVTARSSTDVWAVGVYANTNTNIAATLVEHWNGSQWSIMDSPNGLTCYSCHNEFRGVSALSANDVWAVGIDAHYFTADNRTLIERYTGPCAPSTPTPPPTSPTSTPQLTPTRTPSTTFTPSPSPAPCEMDFTDVQQSDYFYQAVLYLYCHGDLSGYADGTFRPYNSLTRAQLSKIVVLAIGWELECPDTGHFTDVSPDNPFYCYVETAYAHSSITGYSDGTFRPDNPINRGQLCKVVVLGMGWGIDTQGGPHFTDVFEVHPFYTYIETAYNRGIINGYTDGTFRPQANARRGATASVIYQAIIQGDGE